MPLVGHGQTADADSAEFGEGVAETHDAQQAVMEYLAALAGQQEDVEAALDAVVSGELAG